MARKCSVCGKNADSLLVTANTIGKSVLCESCYAKIPSYKVNRKFTSLEEVNKTEAQVLQEAETAGFPESVRKDIRDFYQDKKNPFLDDERLRWVTTTPSFEGYRITKYLGVVSGEMVLGTGIVSSWESSVADTFGGESSSYKEKIDYAEKTAAIRAVRDAAALGANAIVGAKLDLETFTHDLIVVMVSGTAVYIEKQDDTKASLL
ncbi:MAG: YbjQ family protein [Lactimicrobium sp.]|jgi:uncharacterized protein YbjQ (UPF0145 family)|uniref:YbjQ family protein n=1 Tax=Lactimicrobium sp. TaxID=2563780 RepID=UPI002F35878B